MNKTNSDPICWFDRGGGRGAMNKSNLGPVHWHDCKSRMKTASDPTQWLHSGHADRQATPIRGAAVLLELSATLSWYSGNFVKQTDMAWHGFSYFYSNKINARPRASSPPLPLVLIPDPQPAVVCYPQYQQKKSPPLWCFCETFKWQKEMELKEGT